MGDDDTRGMLVQDLIALLLTCPPYAEVFVETQENFEALVQTEWHEGVLVLTGEGAVAEDFRETREEMERRIREMGDDEFYEPAPDGVERPDDDSMDLTCGVVEPDSIVPNAGEIAFEEPDA